jgi:sialic acid synthase SpsE|tara:strand:- start:2422 stop:3135 length:714 start_codon:yes stop_codon:yes gene_type:complete
MYIISEIFPQHSGNLLMAEQMILQSKLSGASAVKMQLYPDNMFSNDGFDRSYLTLSFESLKRLTEYSNKIGISIFATAFTLETLEWCKELNFPFLKVPSRMHKENPDLIEKIYSEDKDVFVSVPENLTLDVIQKSKKAKYLYCVSKYPTLLEEVSFPIFSKDGYLGFSDHSIGIAAALYASAKGCKILEKHFTISKAFQKSSEKAHLGAMDEIELKNIYNLSNEFELIGKKPKKISE